MSIVLEKTWLTSTYYSSVSTNSNANFIIGIKNMLKSAGWEFVSGSDSVSVINAPGTDPWIDYTDIVVSATVAHSWIVLKNTNISANFSICLDFKTSALSSISAYCTTAGYQSDGTTSDRPSVNIGGYENNLINNDTWVNGAAGSRKSLIIYSSDYKCYRIFNSSGASGYNNQWFFEVPKSPSSWFTVPYLASITTYNSIVTYANSCVTSVTKFKTDLNSASVNVGFGCIGLESAFGVLDVGIKEDFNGNFILSPIFLISLNSSYPGIYGELYDMYWTSQGFETTFPYVGGFLKTSASDRGLIVFGPMAFGNDGNYNPFSSV